MARWRDAANCPRSRRLPYSAGQTATRLRSVEPQAPQRQHETDGGDAGCDQRQRREAEPAIDGDAAGPGTESIAEIERGDVEAGGQRAATGTGRFQHAKLERGDGRKGSDAQ